MKKSKSNFYFCFFSLSKTQRHAINALYAFCRHIDDIADECSSKELAERQLVWWQEEIDRVYHASPQHAIGVALQHYSKVYQWPKILFEEMIAGMFMDINHQGYTTFEALYQYCYRVASVVGLLACRIFGYKSEETLLYAEKLGVALQLVNIIRDVGEDIKRERLYIPETILIQYNLTKTNILQASKRNVTKLALDKISIQARTLFNQALTVLPESDRLSQLPGLMMGNLYFYLLGVIQKNHYTVFDHKFSLSLFRKLWIILKTMQQEKQRSKKALLLT